MIVKNKANHFLPKEILSNATYFFVSMFVLLIVINGFNGFFLIRPLLVLILCENVTDVTLPKLYRIESVNTSSGGTRILP